MLLHNQLRRVLGRDRVFLDVGENEIPLGESWQARVREAVAKCDVLLALIDEEWAYRLKNEDDPLRFELETALAAERRIVPVLVAGTTMPTGDQFPPKLVNVPVLQAHEIRPSTPEADARRLVRALTGKDPWVGSSLDRWDLVSVTFVVALGLLVWGSMGWDALNVGERWLWGSALSLFVLLTVGARRVVSGFWGHGYRVDWRRLRIVLTLAIPLAGMWTYEASLVYRTPVFQQGGILVARFRNDPADRYQKELAESLRVEIAGVQVGAARGVVKELPRRVTTEALARRFGQSARATIVLWGGDVRRDRSPTLKVTFLGLALFDVPDVPIEDKVALTGDLRNVNVPSDLRVLQRVIPRLLEGYRSYHAAADSFGYRGAAEYFHSALKHLEGNRHQKDRLDPLDAALGSLHFYLANSLYAFGQRDSAEVEYEAAINHSLNENRRLQYLEPLNNLASLLLEEGRADSAIKVLRQADLECREPPTEVTCAYVWYNLGNILLDFHQFEQACPSLEQAARRVEQTGSSGPVDSVHQRFLGFAYQDLAYCLVKLADSAESEAQKVDLLRRAEQAWRAGQTTLSRDSSVQVPARFQLTLGR
ncbi:MAG: hypothetical protein ACREJ9_03570, partial [Candidatus Rokuibacteriota bacterium]